MVKSLYTVKEAAIVLFGQYTPGNRNRVYRFIESGELTAIKDGRKYWIRRSSLITHGVNEYELEQKNQKQNSNGLAFKPKPMNLNNMNHQEKHDLPNRTITETKDLAFEDHQAKFLTEKFKSMPMGSKKDLAKHCGVKPESVSRWISGKSLIEKKMIRKVADFFEANISDIWGERTELNVKINQSSLDSAENINDLIETCQKIAKKKFGFNISVKISKDFR